jgi:hypothetical protein
MSVNFGVTPQIVAVLLAAAEDYDPYVGEPEFQQERCGFSSLAILVPHLGEANLP